MLRKGGNAVDAAVAAAFVSCLAEPALVNIGGSGIAQVFNPEDGQTTVYDFFSTMPGLGTEEGSGIIDFRRIYIDFGPTRQPFYIGRASVAVPGLVKGLCQLLADRGRLPLAEVLAPAIQLARAGITLDAQQTHMIGLVSPILLDTPQLAAFFRRGENLVQAGDVIRYPALAETLEKLAQAGPELFYTGEIGQAIAHDQRRRGGFVTRTDLQAYAVHQDAPIQLNFRDYTLSLPASASMGGVLIAFSLKLLAAHSLEGILPHSREHIRLLAEVMRLTNQARLSWDVKRNQEGALDYFLSEAHLAPYRQKLQDALAGHPTLDPIQPPTPPNTTHLSVADDTGMIVSLTHSPGENAGFVVGETGVTLNNMLGEMDLHPKGFHLLAPGERLQTMMSPVLAFKEGRPVLAVGSGGSNRLRTAILQTIVNFIDFNMPLTQAITAPRVHFEEDILQLEGGIEPEVALQLDRDYEVNRWAEQSMFFGGAHAVAFENGHWTAAGDPRRGGSTVIVE